jgi:hypothetical protein
VTLLKKVVQFCVDIPGFGVSLTQASRYGKLEDYLIDEQIQTQREYVSNYSDG